MGGGEQDLFLAQSLFYIMLYGRFIQSKQVHQDAPFHDPLKTLKFKKTLASDCVIKKDVQTIPFLIYYVKLYMLHPLISTLISLYKQIMLFYQGDEHFIHLT